MRDLKPMILFVDDEELARRTFKKIAEKEFRVLLAESVDDAIGVLEEHHEDIGVLLSDQRMPGRLGVDLLENCRKNYPKIIRMLTTAYSELNDAIAAVNRGEIMRYIEKPWGNIDGLLIDLRVAMSLYEMRAENEQLVAEKLSVGYKTARLDKIRTLITVAACQPTPNKLAAAESFLRQVADVDAYREMPSMDDMKNFQVFGQPLGESISAVEIGTYFSSQNSELVKVESWSELQSSVSGMNIELNLNSAGDSSPPAGGIALLRAANIALSDPEQGTLYAKIEANESGSKITLTSSSGETSVLSDWITGASSFSSLNYAVAALLHTFLLAAADDGHAKLHLSENGLVGGLELHFYGDGDQSVQSAPAQDYDWIDDLMILFS